MEPKKISLKLAISSVVLIVVATVALAYYYMSVGTPAPGANQSPGEKSQPKAAGAESLGSKLYDKTQNPVENKLPDTPNAAPNPLKDAYKNPFQ